MSGISNMFRKTLEPVMAPMIIYGAQGSGMVPTSLDPHAPKPGSQAATSPSQGPAGKAMRMNSGASTTMLSGVGGVDPRLLAVGKNSLLGA